MKKTILSNTIESLSISKEYTTFLFFIFIFGLSTGVFFEIMMSTDIKSDMQYYLENLLRYPIDGDFSKINSFVALLSSIITNIVALSLIALSGYTRFSFPAASIVLFLKGISLGYCCALILETLTLKGVLIIILSLLPQNTLLLPAFFVSANVSISKSALKKHKKNKGTVRSLSPYDIPYLYIHAFLFIVVILSCFIQSIFLPVAARLI